jgi:hypothetical protein
MLSCEPTWGGPEDIRRLPEKAASACAGFLAAFEERRRERGVRCDWRRDAQGAKGNGRTNRTALTPTPFGPAALVRETSWRGDGRCG